MTIEKREFRNIDRAVMGTLMVEEGSSLEVTPENAPLYIHGIETHNGKKGLGIRINPAFWGLCGSDKVLVMKELEKATKTIEGEIQLEIIAPYKGSLAQVLRILASHLSQPVIIEP